jgi:hypothetical protein
VVTTCVDDEDFNDPTLMLTESGVGVLAFVDATYIGCGQPPVSGASAGGFDLLRHLGNVGRMLLPQPAVATVVMPGMVGGSAKGVESVFDTDPVAEIVLSVFQQPTPNPVKKNAFFHGQVPGEGVGRDWRGCEDRQWNGDQCGRSEQQRVPMALTLDPAGDAPPFSCGKPGLPTCTVITTSVGDIHGLAEFVLSSASTGALKLFATGTVVDRDGVVQGTSTQV